MLGGFALENALKAFLVSENPEWISNGRLSRKLRSHSLITLQQQIKRVPFKKSLLRVLLEFEEGLDSMGPVPVRTGCVALWTSNSPDREVVGWLFDVNGRTMGSGSASC